MQQSRNSLGPAIFKPIIFPTFSFDFRKPWMRTAVKVTMKLFFHVRLLALKCLDFMLVAADMSQVLRVAYAGDWQHHVWGFP